MNDSMRRIIEGKRAERERLATLPFARKLEILEQLRSRSLELGRNALRVAIPHRDDNALSNRGPQPGPFSSRK